MLHKFLASTTTLITLCAILVLAALCGRVMSRTTIVRLGYALAAQNQKTQALNTELNALRTELAARRSPDALAREAHQRFALDAPKHEQIITVTSRVSP